MLAKIEQLLNERELKIFNKNKQTLKFKKKDTVFCEGEITNAIYFIKTGKVKLISKSTTNEIKLVRIASNNDILGHRGISRKWKYSVTAVCLEDCSIISIPIDDFKTILHSNTEVTYELLMFFADELADTEQKIKLENIPVKNKLARAIIYNAKIFGVNQQGLINHTLSRSEFAQLIGTTYESVIRNLAQLNKEKIIALEKKEIRILDKKALYNLFH